ncbi:hypothetical protein TVAG_206770 [Trichomonas vaginalis G3]|uniref:BTB domain-containing protein n=1 Tax=Trichomonas vaginalis (strain ATCC PRA-98 / G3) TaxID=412133 RepID=A2EY55_TRIV3|nr:Potassium Channel Kv1.1, Chain A domain-containing protein [Trichomonas vaginalis G3]EAY02401.1 hypothetical protein TVAG_206770 [Trichomonas vaginalis G3]KAI5535520.1 Potassium Channel Kv1.1, Chain A domain-containing protein [Trichomonas vaginalis G3]|eukprot:XP_001330654.1 hypothetical protein [Trichomonas vaginalis G3]
MFSAEELTNYFDNLPRDLTIIIGSKTYKANKQVMCIFSGIIQEKLQNSADNEIKLEIEDPKEMIPLVISFLHGHQINISYENDFYLNKISDELKISSLKEAVQESLNEPITISNIISRLEQNTSQVLENENSELLKFLVENIEEIQKDDSLFLSDPRILLKALEKSKFENDDSKNIFKLKCASRHIDNFDDFLSLDDFQHMSIDVICEFVTNPYYSTLDQKMPSILIASRIVSAITSLNTDINEINEKIQNYNSEIKELQEEHDRVMVEKCQSDEKYLKVAEQFKQFKLQMISTSERIESHANSLNSFKISEKTVNEIGSKLNFLKVTCERLQFFSERLSRAVILYPETTKNVNQVYNDWKGSIAPLQQEIANLESNEKDIDSIAADFHKLVEAIRKLSNI